MANSNRKQSVHIDSDYVGSFHGVPIISKDWAEPNTIYFFNDKKLVTTFSNLEPIKLKRKWRTKIYDTLRTLTRRFGRDPQ